MSAEDPWWKAKSTDPWLMWAPQHSPAANASADRAHHARMKNRMHDGSVAASMAKAIAESSSTPTCKKTLLWTLARAFDPSKQCPKMEHAADNVDDFRSTLAELRKKVEQLDAKICDAHKQDHDASTSHSLNSLVKQTKFKNESCESFYIGDADDYHSIECATQTDISLDSSVYFAEVSAPCDLIEAAVNNACSELAIQLQDYSPNSPTLQPGTDSCLSQDSQKHIVLGPTCDPFPSALDDFLNTFPVTPESVHDATITKDRSVVSKLLHQFHLAADDYIDISHDLYDACMETTDTMPLVSENGDFIEVSLSEFYKVFTHLESGPAILPDHLLFPFGFDHG